MAVTSDEAALTSIAEITDFTSENTICTVLTLDGKVIAKGRNLIALTSNLPSGIYAVRSGKNNAKVIVR